VSELVFQAFRAIGPPRPEYRRAVGFVPKAIRESRDEEALALFGVGRDPDPDPAFDHDACDRVAEIAERAGASGFVALDLYTEMVNPGWSPFSRSVEDGGRV
jgi:hypothetical protein